jgi:hypothetical protein
MPTFTQIGSAVVVGGAGQSSIDFSSIPSTYTDLVLKVSVRWSNAGPDGFNISFNGSTSSFTCRFLEGSGSAATSSTGTRLIGGLEGTGYTANTFGSVDVYIPNYAGSTNKSYSSDSVTENNATQAFSQIIAGIWANTAAINQITLAPSSGTFVQYSTAYLYGVSNA